MTHNPNLDRAALDLDALEREARDSDWGGFNPENALGLIRRVRDAEAELNRKDLFIVRLERVRVAAAAYVDRIEAEAASVEPWNAPELDSGIAAALAELDK